MTTPERDSSLRTTAEKLGRYAPGTLVAGGVRAGDSPAAGWSDVLVEIYRRRRVEESIVVPAIAEPQIILVLAGRTLAEERELGGGPWSGRVVTAGEFFLTTTSTPYEVRWRALGAEDYQTMHVFIGLPVFARAAREVLGADAGVPALREVFGERDAVLSALLEPLRVEVSAFRPAPASALFLQGLAQSLAVHLIRTYPAVPETAASSGRGPRRGGLPACRLRRVTDYLEAHLAEEITVARLAAEAGLSEFHFSRLFKATTGFSPSQYLMRLRLTRTRHLLRETTKSMIEIGLEVGFTSPSYFAHLFRREVGVTPTEYRGGNR